MLKINNVEVFTYDGGKTFGYDIIFKDASIRKINKHMVISFDSVEISINEKGKLVYNLSANAFKSAFVLFNLGKYTNTKDAKSTLLLFFKNLESKILDNKNKEKFLEYSVINEKCLDIQDENKENTDEYKKSSLLILKNNLELKEYFFNNVL
jgi:hypothetical protein